MKRVLALLVGLLALGFAQDLKPEYIAQAVKRTITVGGDLKQWEGLPQYPISLSNGFPAVPVKGKGYYSLAWDDNNLYVLGVFEQAKDTVLAKLPAENPEWWNDDVMELFFRTDPKAKTAEDLHLAINPAGTRFQAYNFTTDYVSKGRIEDTRWVLELAIPFKGKLPKVSAGATWNLKVGREHQKAGEYPLWPMGGDFNAGTNYGYLVFTDKLQEVGALFEGVKANYAVAAAPLNSRLKGLGSYAVYYGRSQVEVKKLGFFDLVIVQPNTLSKADLEALKANGTRAIAYLSIGELEPKSVLEAKVDPKWVLGTNKNWGSKFINAGESGWQKLMQEETARILSLGYDGVFLDTLDTVDLYPQIGVGLLTIIQNIRKAFPDALIVQNRGFSLLRQTAELVDGVMYENFSSGYSFEKKVYGPSNNDPTVVLSYAQRGLVVLALDYAQPISLSLIRQNYARARSFGFVPYVSTLNLNRVFIHKP